MSRTSFGDHHAHPSRYPKLLGLRITVLLAVMVQFKSKGIKFSGNFPEKQEAKELLLQSRFFDHLSGRITKTSSYHFIGDSIFTHGKQKVDSEFSQELIAQASQTIWGRKKRCRGVQRVLIELMHNTHNHASPSHKKELWWISLQHLKKEKKVIFCFVDFGIGVFESLALKPQDDILHKVWKVIRTLLMTSNHAKALRLMLSGEVHSTVTKKYFRGKGIPGIYKALNDNHFSNMFMITNNAYYSSRDESYRNMEKNFSGTFISWELSTNNQSLENE